jgi:hypothetical protein
LREWSRTTRTDSWLPRPTPYWVGCPRYFAQSSMVTGVSRATFSSAMTSSWRRSSNPPATGARRVSQAAAVPQRRGDRDAGPGRQGDQAGRVAADDHHARFSGQGQPVSAAPAQRAGDAPVGHAAGAVDVGEPVHHVPAKGRRAAQGGRDRERQHPGSGRRAGGLARSRSRGRDDEGDQRAGHGCLPLREARPVSAGGRPQASAGPSGCSSGALRRVMYHHSGCPRGGLAYSNAGIFPDRCSMTPRTDIWTSATLQRSLAWPFAQARSLAAARDCVLRLNAARRTAQLGAAAAVSGSPDAMRTTLSSMDTGPGGSRLHLGYHGVPGIVREAVRTMKLVIAWRASTSAPGWHRAGWRGRWHHGSAQHSDLLLDQVGLILIAVVEGEGQRQLGPPTPFRSK